MTAAANQRTSRRRTPSLAKKNSRKAGKPAAMRTAKMPAGRTSRKVSEGTQPARLPERKKITETANLLRALRKLLERFEKSFPLPEGNPVDPFLRELAYASIVNQVLELDLDTARTLLKDAREHQKAAAYSATSSRRVKKMTPQQEALEVRRRWRELYGLPPNPEAAAGG